MDMLYNLLEWLMNSCYSASHNYGYAIILFTLLSKILLLPVSVWVQNNSIRLVKMQPEINFLKAQYFGDKDTLAEEQAKIFKKEHYNPLLSLIPLVIQLILLVGVIEVIKAGIQNPEINMNVGGIDLSRVPDDYGVSLIWSPLVAGISAWILCIAQNHRNVLQMEQSYINKYSTMIFSIGLSLYLGWFVPVGVAVYWIASNLLAVLQLYALNRVISPKKYVDYELLEKSKRDLMALSEIGKKEKRRWNGPEARKEKEDYKRFCGIINKHLVFYSEGNGFYKYYQGIIEYILEHTNLAIHYITSDYNDEIFKRSEKEEQLKAYYIGEKRLITLMMKMEADMVVMTMPDLDNYHIKRSYIQKDIEYIYIPHGMDSLNMTMRLGSTDHFDTIFCTGVHQKEEHEKTEAFYHIPQRTMVEWGYSLLDQMRRDYVQSEKGREKQQGQFLSILIAPSWQKDNIMELCLEDLLNSLHGKGYMITVRPHPQQVRHQPERMEQLKTLFKDVEDIDIQTDFSLNSTVFNADLMITDWSGIAYEYAFATYKPVLFVDTPVKVMNPEYRSIGVEPINIWMRDKIGRVIKPDEAINADHVVGEILSLREAYHDTIYEFVCQYVYHPGKSAEVGGNYMINQIRKRADQRKKERTK